MPGVVCLCSCCSESHCEGFQAKELLDYEEVPTGPGSFGPFLLPEMKLVQRIKPHLLKVTLTLVATLLIVQYWRRAGLETPRFEPLFSIDSVKSKMGLSSDPSTENVTILNGTEEANCSSSHNSSGISPPASQFQETATRLPNQQPLCPPIPPSLNGPINIIKKYEEMSVVEKFFGELEPGGMFRPKECKARYVVALVIPYRDRPNQLSIFLNNIHRLLMRQQVDYGIFIIEQDGTGPFNRGKLMNVGFVEASKMKEFDCFIFHDVDLIPEDDRNLYTCPEQPRHMSVAVDKFNYMLPYEEIFGGVCAFSAEHFQLVNGFSNMFWGWGGEDDDMYSRVRRKGLHISRYIPTVARYKMLPHDRQPPNPKRYEVMQKSKKMYETDGLINLEYEKKAIEFKRLYTWILVDLYPPR